MDRVKGRISRAPVFYNPLNWFTKNKIEFFGTAAFVFFSLLYVFYEKYGFEFLYESYIYHSLRVDHRHNFSFNYYFEYIHFDELPDTKYIVRKLGFMAQWGLVSFVGIRYYYDLLTAIFMQTYIFVMFNRVITAQYFLWFIILLPLVAVKVKVLMSFKWAFTIFLVFLTAEMLVNLSCAPLELYGIPSYDYIFLATHGFLIVNTCLIHQLIKNMETHDTLHINEQFENVYPKAYCTTIRKTSKLKDD